MNVILLEDITNVGKLGDQIAVKAGFARNYLFPKGKAVSATQDNIIVFEKRRAELEQRATEKLQAAEKRAEALVDLVVNIAARASDEGKLYGSLGPREIATYISQAGSAVEKSEVHMPSGPIRQVGEHTVNLAFHTGVTIEVHVVVTAEE